MDADTVDRELSVARKAIDWWQRRGRIWSGPAIRIRRHPAPPDRTRALVPAAAPLLLGSHASWCANRSS